MFAIDENVYQKKLTDYDKIREPHKLINDHAIKREELLNSVNSNFICPICLDLIQNTMVTECLHRFCSECICNAIYKSKRECPTCRKKVISKRNLRPDPNFDTLIAAVWPDRNLYEQLQKEEANKCKQNVQAYQTSFEECIKQKTLKQNNPTDLLTSIENNNIRRQSSSTIQTNDDVGNCSKKRGGRRPLKFLPKTTEQTSPDSGFGADILPNKNTKNTTNVDDDFGDSDSSMETYESEESISDENIGVCIEDFESSNDESPPKKAIKLEKITPSQLEIITMPPKLNWLPPNISSLNKFQAIDKFMKDYLRQSIQLGLVKILMQPLQLEYEGIYMNGNDERQIVQHKFRVELMHNETIGMLHSILTTPENHPMKRKTDGTFPQLHLFIQGPSKQYIQLYHNDTICTVLGLANRKNFFDFPTIYFI